MVFDPLHSDPPMNARTPHRHLSTHPILSSGFASTSFMYIIVCSRRSSKYGNIERNYASVDTLHVLIVHLHASHPARTQLTSAVLPPCPCPCPCPCRCVMSCACVLVRCIQVTTHGVAEVCSWLCAVLHHLVRNTCDRNGVSARLA